MEKSNLASNRGFLLRDGDLVVRPLRDTQSDYSVLHDWLQNPLVLEYYRGRDQVITLSSVQESYAPKVMAAQGKVPCMIEFLKRPIGYLQFCLLKPDENIEYGYSVNEAIYRMGLFIGATELRGYGLGRRALRCALNYLFTDLDAHRVVVNPHTDQLRAVRSYTAVGFRKVKLLPKYAKHENRLVDCWLMEAAREQNK